MAQILATGFQRAAKSSSLEVDGKALAFGSWTANIKADNLPTENFTSFNVANGMAYEEGILGFIGCDGDFAGDWDASANPIDFTGLVTPPGLYPRDDLPSTFLYISVVDNTQYFEFPYLRIRGSTVNASVKGLVTFTAKYMNQGIFDFPTSSI